MMKLFLLLVTVSTATVGASPSKPLPPACLALVGSKQLSAWQQLRAGLEDYIGRALMPSDVSHWLQQTLRAGVSPIERKFLLVDSHPAEEILPGIHGIPGGYVDADGIPHLGFISRKKNGVLTWLEGKLVVGFKQNSTPEERLVVLQKINQAFPNAFQGQVPILGRFVQLKQPGLRELKLLVQSLKDEPLIQVVELVTESFTGDSYSPPAARLDVLQLGWGQSVDESYL